MIALNEDECWTSGVRHGRALLLAACPVPVSRILRIEKSSHVFSTLDFTLGVSYFRVRRQLDLSHVDPRVGPDRTVAAREAGNLVVVTYLRGRRFDPPPASGTGGSSFGTPLTCRPIYGFSRMGSVRGRLSSSRWVSLSYFDSTRWRLGLGRRRGRAVCLCMVRVVLLETAG